MYGINILHNCFYWVSKFDNYAIKKALKKEARKYLICNKTTAKGGEEDDEVL